MLEVLLEHDATVLQLAEPHPLSLPTLLQHLGVLEKYGLIRTYKVGRQRICSIVPEPDALFAAERRLRSVMWARYGTRLGSIPEDYPRLRASVRVR